MGVGGCGCPISSKHVLIGMHRCAVMYSAPISTSAADPMTNFIILLITCMGPLMGHVAGDFPDEGLDVRKRCAPALLLALGTERYDASLCACKHMSLALTMIVAFGCVAT